MDYGLRLEKPNTFTSTTMPDNIVENSILYADVFLFFICDQQSNLLRYEKINKSNVGN